MAHAEDILLGNHSTNRHKAYTILKTLRDRHFSFNGSPITNYIMKTLVLYECEKHVSDHGKIFFAKIHFLKLKFLEWEDYCLGDRVIGLF